MTAPYPVDFYFDFSCPYAYLASTRLDELAGHTGAEVRLKPVLLGGLFRSLDQPQNMSTTLSAPKAENNRMDLVRWASWLEVPLARPLRHPNRSVEALRHLLAAPGDAARAIVDAFYRIYWVEGGDISDVAVLQDRLRGLGLDAAAISQRAASQEIKDELRRRTSEATALGVFGVPTFITNGQKFWGQDRIEMAAEAATGWSPNPQIEAEFSFNQSDNEAN